MENNKIAIFGESGSYITSSVMMTPSIKRVMHKLTLSRFVVMQRIILLLFLMLIFTPQ